MNSIIKLLENPTVFGVLGMAFFTAVFTFIFFLMLSTTKPRKR